MSVSSPTLAPNPWLRILDALEKKINRHSYDTWLKPTRYSHSSGGTLFVWVPKAEFCQVGDKYADLIQEALDNLGLEYQEVKFVPPGDDPSAMTAAFPPMWPLQRTRLRRVLTGTERHNLILATLLTHSSSVAEINSPT